MGTYLFVATKDGVVAARRVGDAWQAFSRSLTSHRVNTLSVQGGVVLAGTTEGIFRSEDVGQTWRRASDGLSQPHVRWLAHHPDGSGTVLAGTEPAAIFLSRDGGETWTERPEVAELREEHGWYLPYSPGAGCVRGFAFHGNRIYAAVEVGGLLRSDDSGETWKLAGGSSGKPHGQPEGFVHPDIHSIAVHPNSPDLVFAPTGGGLYRSRDGGETWEPLYRCYCRAIWLDSVEADHLVFGPADSVDRNGRIEESSDGGGTWRTAAQGLEVPWPRHMVERVLQCDHELLAVLSNGDLIAAPLVTLHWQYVLPEVGWVRALATMSA